MRLPYVVVAAAMPAMVLATPVAKLQTAIAEDVSATIAALREGAAAGSAASQHGLGLAALKGRGLPKSAEQAFQWFQLAADQGYPASQAMLGNMYLRGIGTAKDIENGRGLVRDFAQAKRWLQQAADQGEADAMAKLAGMYRDAKGVPRDYAQAQHWYRRGAIAGNANAAFNLGRMYEDGLGMERDDAMAAVFYRAAADRKHGDAVAYLGKLYELGAGVEQDIGQAVALYRQAAEQGNIYGLYNLAGMYEVGLGVSEDLRLAAEYRLKAAERGYPAAMAALAYQYHNGRGVPQDSAFARYWYEKAAELHDVIAAYNLADMYAGGLGIPADQAQALRWYRRAAEAGDADAQFKLGQALFAGKGTPQNWIEAAEWYRKSADQKQVEAQSMLGKMHLHGWGMAVDTEKGLALLRQAAAQRDTEAAASLGYAYEEGVGVGRDMAQAIAWYEKATESLVVQVRLGTLYLGAGKNPERGLQLLKQADAQTTSADFSALGWLYGSVHNYARAEWAFLRGLDMLERTPGVSDADVVAYLEQVTRFFAATVQNQKNEPFLRRRLQMTEKMFDAKSSEMELVLEMTGDLHQRLGRYADAEAVYLRTLAIKEKLYGARSLKVAAMLDSISGLFLATDQFDTAAIWSRRALVINEELNEIATSNSLRQLAAVMLARADYAEAEKLLLRSLALMEKSLGQDSPFLAGPLNTLAFIYDKQLAYDKAGATLERAIKLHGAQAYPEPMAMANYQNNLASIRIGQKKYAEAEALLQESQASKVRLLGDNNSELSSELYLMGRLYKSRQQYDKAQASLQRALALRDVPIYRGRSTADVLQELGEVYRAQGMDEQAEAALSRALAIRSKIFDEGHPALKATRASLAELRRKAGPA
jgi:TPR repeat protein